MILNHEEIEQLCCAPLYYKQHPMIAPYDSGDKKPGVISYGNGSYGYDVRLGRKFKLFHDTVCAEIDPKAIDERAFIDFEGDICRIPPNSYVLAETVETFCVPDDVLGVVVGKCLTGDTRVVLGDGSYLPLSQFPEHAVGTETVSMSDYQMGLAGVSGLTRQGHRQVYRIETSQGRTIRATRNHPFYRPDGWVELKDLKDGDRIATPGIIPVFGTERLHSWEADLLGFMISEGQCHTPGSSPCFTNSDQALVTAVTAAVKTGLGCQTSYNQNLGYRLVNRIGRGGKMTKNRATEWLRSYGLDVKSGGMFVPQKVFRSEARTVARFLRALFSGDGCCPCREDGSIWAIEYATISRMLAEDVRHLLCRFGIVASISYKSKTGGYSVVVTGRRNIRRFAAKIGFWPGSDKQELMRQRILRCPSGDWRNDQSEKRRALPKDGFWIVDKALKKAQLSYNRCGIKPSQTVITERQVAQIAELTRDPSLLALAKGHVVWDRITSISPSGAEETFDLTVPSTENFVANDIVVHNSTYARVAAIANITPLEPGWRGKLTLEIANLCRVPIRLYADEGIAQVLFFRGNPTKFTYAKRSALYQDQVGLTLARVR